LVVTHEGKALYFFSKTETDFPVTRRYIPEERSPQDKLLTGDITGEKILYKFSEY
jgi:hypothetical protein